MAQSDREFVRGHYLDARAEWVTFPRGTEGPATDGYWLIRTNSSSMQSVGVGQTRDQAWSDAAARIRARTP